MRLKSINPLRLFKRKSRAQRILDGVRDALPKSIGKNVEMPDLPSDKTLRTGLLTVGGLAGLTASSAGISSLRRRGEAPKDGS